MEGWPQRRWRLVVLGACGAAALLSTWPLELHLRTAVSLGNRDGGDPPLGHIDAVVGRGTRLPHGFAELWDAPIFHPVGGAFPFVSPVDPAGAPDVDVRRHVQKGSRLFRGNLAGPLGPARHHGLGD